MTSTMVVEHQRESSPVKQKNKNKNKKRRRSMEELNLVEENNNKNNSGTMPIKKNKSNKKKKRDEDRQQKQEPGSKVLLPTVSLAVCGSIIDKTQSLELATLLAGQIARAATIFRIDEVVVFDSKDTSIDVSLTARENDGADEDESGAEFLVRILQFLETPQYLRRSLFPMLKSLRYAGSLPPLDAPHHVRRHEWSPFREGVTLDRNNLKSKGTIIDVGLSKNVLVEEALEPGIRVTVAMGADRNIEIDHLKKVVKPSTPREEMGLYWGYKVRYCVNISHVFTGSEFQGGYDYIVGTSEHGKFVESSKLIIPNFRHLLIVFGGPGGLEESIEEDSNLKGKGVHDVFSSYLNTCPDQGSRTIRTEEAVLISLQYFQEPIKRAQERPTLAACHTNVEPPSI